MSTWISTFVRLAATSTITAALTAVSSGQAEAAPALVTGKIAYTVRVDPYGPDHRISVVDVVTHQHRVLPVPAGFTSADTPAISPDGRRIAFMAVKDFVPQLWVMRADGTRARKVAGFWGGRYNPRSEPAWTRDGSRIVFPVYDATTTQTKLFIVPANGSRLPRQIPHEGDVSSINNISVAPDGAITFVTNPIGTGYNVWVREPGGEQRLLVSDARDPDFSPDGTKVYSSVRRELDQIYSADRRTGQLTQITTAPTSHWAPAVAPSGQAIAYRRVDGECNRVYLLSKGVESLVSAPDECLAGSSIDWSR